MQRLFVCIAVVTIICITATVSYSEQYWAKTYGRTNDYNYYSIQQTTDGGYIVADDSGLGVLKLDSSGDVIWQKTYGGFASDYARSIQQTTDGGYIVAGHTYSFGAGQNDIWLLKLDSSGIVQWQKTYGGTDNDYARSIQQTTDGGYIVAGETRSFGAGNLDLWILKLDSSGDVIWQKTYGGVSEYGHDIPRSIQQTTDGGYIVAGYTDSFGAGSYDFWILKLDSSGDVIWQKTYGGSDNDFAYSIQQTTDGGYIVAGRSYSFGAGGLDLWVLKLNNSGDVVWQKNYGGSQAHSIQQTTDGGYIVAGATSSFGAGGLDLWVLKLDTAGDVIWQKTYGGSYHDYADSIQQTTDGGYIVAGRSYSFGAFGGLDLWVLKLDSDGEIPNCSIIAISNASLSNTFVTGQDSSAIIASQSITISDTNSIPQDTSTESSAVCCYDPDDYDGDGTGDDCDNCPDNSNPLQEDTDEDGFGNACDQDDDNDGVLDGNDNCPVDFNPLQEDTDEDGFGDACDQDDDNDGVLDGNDNCPVDFNPLQEDYDGDGTGDNCDECTDTDEDGYGNSGFPNNTCPLDNCPDNSNPLQEDTDGDEIGNACDQDDDNDGIPDGNDNCPDTVNPDQEDFDGDGIGDACDSNPYLPDLPPAADGHWFDYYCCWCCARFCSEICCDLSYYGIDNGIIVAMSSDCGEDEAGILEFDLSSIDVSLARGQMQAVLSLTVKDGSLPADRCLSLYSIQDANENGVIEEVDIDTVDYIGEVCADLQPGNTITFDVTAAVEHDLFDPDQTIFSGFIIDKGQDWNYYWRNYIEFYDHTDPANGPRLSVLDINDLDGDGIVIDDNCPETPNPLQEDQYPPQGNNIGDACDCECDFDCSGGVDAIDVTAFLIDFGRSTFFNPCTNADPCNGDVDCNSSVDALDVNEFLEDFGRSQFFNPCPSCVAGAWCEYP